MENSEVLETVVLRWKGPYTYEQIQELPDGNGLYLLTGKKRYSRASTDKALYCGITEGKFRTRINEKHHKKQEIREANLKIWLGQIIYPAKFDRSLLERTETCLISFWQPELNEKKKAYYPAQPICFVSQWCRTDGSAYGQRFPEDVRDLQDVLWWDTDVWRTGDLKIVRL
ncbi:hypothetical protein [Hymenobacter sp. CRA2]|uniref:hypothetical protein n=1 Tax=Hymenobacter sp. CRA2 TaxID=1955620 RepID=UPI0009D39F45|nr:hypothetical protein [Hymenobacter sp. CRA2]OON70009.1 hypothetical protein B0919_04485 [Hymenobacter sp. CRA2]